MKLNIDIGGGFASMLTLIFITLKLIGQISWSWWWIISPLWISAAVALFIFIMFFTLITIAVMLDGR